MYDYFSVFLVILIAIGLYRLVRIEERMHASEAKLDALLKHFGVEWQQFSEPSEHVKQLAGNPETRIEAIKAYREQTGLSLKAAKEVIDKL